MYVIMSDAAARTHKCREYVEKPTYIGTCAFKRTVVRRNAGRAAFHERNDGKKNYASLVRKCDGPTIWVLEFFSTMEENKATAFSRLL